LADGKFGRIDFDVGFEISVLSKRVSLVSTSFAEEITKMLN